MTFRDCIIKQMQDSASTGDAIIAQKRKQKLNEALPKYDAKVNANKVAGMSDDLAQAEAARSISLEQEFEKNAKLKLATLGAKAQLRISRDMAAYRNAKGEADPGAALLAHIERDQVGEFRAFRGAYEVIRGQYHSGIESFLFKYKPQYAGTVKPVRGLDNIAYELFGENTGDQSAKELAEAVAHTFETARLRANAAGASIPKKNRWGMPQSHDKVRVAKAGRDAWVRYVAERFNVRDVASGGYLQGTEKIKALEEMHATIKTEGMSDLAPAQTAGTSALATQLHQRRFLDANDAKSWLEYHKEFGVGSVFDVVINHLDAMARDTAMMEVFGPNPEATRKFMVAEAKKQAAELDAANPEPSIRLYSQEVDKRIAAFETLWNTATGKNSLIRGSWAGNFLAGTRNVLTGSLLGSTVLLALPGDFFSTALTRRFNGLPASRFMKSYLKNMNPANPADRRLAIRSGLVAESATSMAFSQQRMMGEVLGPEVTKRYTDIALRAQLLTPHTEAIRNAFGMEFMGDLADHAKVRFDKLPERLQKAYRRYGITAEDWELMRKTKIHNEQGATFLRPYDIMTRKDSLGTKAQELADKFMEMILTEREFAIPTASLRARAMIIGDTRGGSLAGEIMRSFAQFKNYPVTVLLLHGRRGLLEASMSSKARYLLSFGIGMTVAAAFGTQMRQSIANGKDPMNMDPTTPEGKKFWAASALAGGGLGIWGDFLFSNVNRHGGSIEKTIAGPIAQTGSDLKNLTIGNVVNILEGEPTKAAKESVDIVGRYAPRPFYLRLAMQRMIFDQLAKESDPNAYQKFRRMEREAYKTYGQEYWWRPGETSPSRPPDFSAAFGKP